MFLKEDYLQDLLNNFYFLQLVSKVVSKVEEEFENSKCFTKYQAAHEKEA